MNVRPKTLLLDVDGVVYRNHKILGKVQKNIVKYVAKELRLSDIDEAYALNEYLYKNFGHTYVGMRCIYNIDKSLDHFVDHVYTPKLLDDVRANIDEVMIDDSNSVRALAEECRNKDIDMYLFSNAPMRWCDALMQTMKVDIVPDNVISCDHDVCQIGGLKPSPNVYDTLHRYLSRKNHDDVTCMFVDDNLRNLMPLLNSPMWRPIFLNNKNDTKLKSKRLMTIYGLNELQTLL